MTQVGDTLREMLKQTADRDSALESALDLVLEEFHCVAGTIHVWDGTGGCLRLRASRNIPAAVLQKIESIPPGKGMAGLAATRLAPVQVCNLQTDDSGVARPGAKATKMEGSISCPILVNGKLVGTLGIAKATPYEFSAEESGALLELGTVIGEFGLSAQS